MFVFIFIAIVTTLYITNSYLIGRFFKKINITNNSSICTIFGFTTIFIFVFIVCYIFYYFACNVFIYIVFFACCQTILLFFYTWNWKYFFIKNDLHWKKTLTFFLTWMFILGICVSFYFIPFEQWQSQLASVKDIFVTHIEVGFDKVISLSKGNSLDNYNSFNFLNLFWIHCWNIQLEDRIVFVLWNNNIVVSFLLACLAAGLTDKEYPAWKIVCQVLITLFACILPLIGYGSFIKINALVPFFILVYLLVLFNTNNTNDKSLFLFLILIALVVTDYTVNFFLVILLWIVAIFYFIKYGISPLGNGVVLLAPIFLMVGAWLNKVIPIIFVIFCFITLLVPFVILKLNNNKNLNAAYSSLNNWILKHDHAVAYAGAIMIVLGIIIVNVFIFQEMYKWNFPIEKFDIFFAFHISNLGVYKIPFIFLLIINIFLSVLYLVATIFYFVLRTKNKNIYKEESLAILVITFMVFCNFLSAHIFNTFFDPLVLAYVNYVPLMAIITFLYKTIYNTKQQATPWKYDWY